jgi:phosphodiesterase/alkaline phosphatase D-like protein
MTLITDNNWNLNHIYRHFNWGKDLDLFLLDDCLYKSLNNLVHNNSDHKHSKVKNNFTVARKESFKF